MSPTLLLTRFRHKWAGSGCSSFLSTNKSRSQYSRPIRTRGSGSRSSRHSTNNPVLLDKFVKHTIQGVTFTARASFNLKVKGSFFDESNSVDRERNKKMNALSYRDHPNKAGEDLDDAGEETVEPKVTDQANKTSPFQFLLYGRTMHHVDSYSVVSRTSDESHIFLSDSAMEFGFENRLLAWNEEDLIAEDPFGALAFMRPNALISVSHPKGTKRTNQSPAEKQKGTYRAVKGQAEPSFRLYCQPQLLAGHDHGVHGRFLLPTIVEAIILHTDRENELEIDGQLLSGLRLVNLNADRGRVRLRDVCARDIRIVSSGNVDSDGLMDGNALIDVRGSGDIIAKHVDGPAIVAKTDLGDISVLGECRSTMSHFAVNAGNVYIRQLFGNAYILIQKVGFVTINLTEGSATAIVSVGGAFCGIEELSSDTTIKVGEGDINVTIPNKYNFRIDVAALNTNIDTRLMNSGDVIFSQEGYQERFRCGCHEGNNDISLPLLTLEAPKGKVSIQFAEKGMEKQYFGTFES